MLCIISIKMQTFAQPPTYPRLTRGITMKRGLLFVSMIALALTPRDAHPQLIDKVDLKECRASRLDTASARHIALAKCRLPSKDFVALVNLAYSEDQADQDILRQKLSLIFPFINASDTQPLLHVLRKLGNLYQSPEERRNHFISIATRHVSLAWSLKNTAVPNPIIQRLREQAGEVLKTEPRDPERAKSLLNVALGLICEPETLDQKRPCMADPNTTQVLQELAWLEEGNFEMTTAAQLYERAADTRLLDDHANRLANLTRAATLWQNEGELHGSDKAFSEAARLYQRLFAQGSEDNAPLTWARALVNYGLAQQKIGERERNPEKLKQSADTLRASLHPLAKHGDTFDRSRARNNLATTLQLLGEINTDFKKYHQSIEIYQDALNDVTKEDMPYQWAALQNNKGIALWKLSKAIKSPQTMANAARAFKAALSVWHRDRHYQDWVAAQNNLGIAQKNLGADNGDTKDLHEAIRTFRTVLKTLKRDHDPAGWAATQHNLGSALWTLGQQQEMPELFEQASSSIDLALKEVKRDHEPFTWATMQHSLGLALFSKADADQNIGMMEQAASTFHLALSVRQHMPLERAATQDALGRAHLFLGTKKRDLDELQHALEAFKDAQAVRVTEARMTRFEPTYAELIGKTELMISNLQSWWP